MQYKIGTPVLYIYNDGRNPERDALGVIIESKFIGGELYYKITFSDGDEDWFSNENRFITKMVHNYRRELNGEQNEN